MLVLLIALTVGVCCCTRANAQCAQFGYDNGDWAWMAGSRQGNNYGVYGAQNVETATNYPGGRDASGGWTDADGNFWVFGGYGYSASAGPPGSLTACLGDLWLYNPDTGVWTWKKGFNAINRTGVYGTQGTEGAANVPGGRYYFMNWTGANGRLYMFGGVGYDRSSTGYLNDLWCYNTVTNNWTWLKGSDLGGAVGTYGTQGVAASTNNPGSRTRGATWTGADGSLWLFGGHGRGAGSTIANLNDLWKFDVTTGNWTWVNGPTTGNDQGVAGTQGVAASGNRPRARGGANTWTDKDGMLWLFGGHGVSGVGAEERYNDVWKYNPATNEWTWVNGSGGVNEPGVYGEAGIAAAANRPGGRIFPMVWVDHDGTAWLFGGDGFGASGPRGMLNDLWKYDAAANMWTWVSGPQAINQSPTYGQQGSASPANIPGARQKNVTWTDRNGRFWLFSGYGYNELGNLAYQSDMWRLNPRFTLETDEDTPASYEPSAVDLAGNGIISIIDYPADGTLEVSGGTTGTLYYVPPAEWSGVTTATVAISNGTCGTTAPLVITVRPVEDCPAFVTSSYTQTIYVNTSTSVSLQVTDTDGIGGGAVLSPPANGAANFISSNTLTYVPNADWTGTDTIVVSLTGGSCGATTASIVISVTEVPPCPDFNYNDGMWTWVGGNKAGNLTGIYGTQNVSAPGNRLGSREAAAGWAGSNGDFWMFGGYGFDETQGPPGLPTYSLSDLWHYNSQLAQWTWKKGGNAVNQYGAYGSLGNEASTNRPGGRYYSMTWKGLDGNLWILGGVGFGSGSSGFLNDLWRYNTVTNNWAWIKGDTSPGVNGQYGTQGTGAIGNKPGSRSRGVTWVGTDGSLWLFGGRGNSSGQSNTLLNDLWRYNSTANTWTWVKGSQAGNQAGTYGIKGTPATANNPGGREGGVGWTDSDGNFWLFGGNGRSASGSGLLNDLWKYDPVSNQWTWMNGSAVENPVGVYGTQGTSAFANAPGGRSSSTVWVDGAGEFWLFGGEGYATTSTVGSLSDIWKYDHKANEWTWINSSNGMNGWATYGTLGVMEPGNRPGGRRLGVPWVDSDGRFRMVSGGGFAEGGFGGYLNDIWLLTPGLKADTLEDSPTTITDIVFGPIGTESISITEHPAHGTLTVVDTTGTLYYVPPANWSGVTTAILSMSRSDCDLTTSILTINVAPINDPPVIQYFGYDPVPACVNQETTFTVTAYDIDGGPLTYYYNYGDGSTSDSVGRHVYTTTGTFIAIVEVNDGIDSTTASVLVTVVYPCPEFNINEWVYQGGSDNAFQPWSTNGPSARHGSASWAGSDGRLWLFGGEGLGGASNADTGRLGDMWRYDVTSGTWQLMNNSTTASKLLNRRNFFTTGTEIVYGQVGVVMAPSPSGRRNATSWVDNQGRFWLFGGYGRGTTRTGYLNDLWMYDPAANLWTCQMESPSDVRIVSQNGWPGQIKDEDWPGWRQHGQSWTDNNGNLWLYGGWGWGSDGRATTGYLSDLWMYDVASKGWLKVSGSSSVNAQGVYTGARPLPGARYNAATWADTAGNLWLFGGWGYGSTDAGHLNDMWKFDTTRTTWTLVMGGGQVNLPGVYAGAPTEMRSGGRYGASSFTGPDGGLWMFGGWGYADNEYGQLNDMWRFDIDTLTWRCVDRRDDRVFHLPGDYLDEGDGMRPGGRERAASWVTPDGSFWMFGGNGFGRSAGPGFLSDLWSYGSAFTSGGRWGEISVELSLDDPAGNAMVGIEQGPRNGEIVIDQGLTTRVVYRPNVGFSGVDKAVLRVYNPACGGDTADVVFRVAPTDSSRVEDYQLY